jgi:hypothetical protein
MNLTVLTFFLVATTLSIALYIFFRKKDVKYLVFSSVGDRNNVRYWTSDQVNKNFDLVLYYYGDEANPQFNADLVVHRKGLKFENFYHFLKNHDIEEYRAIWVVDDDIIIDTASINKMFEIFSQYNLLLAQPSFDEESHAPHTVTRNKAGCILHYTNFVENGVALFSSKVIPIFKETFKDARTGFGIDYIWAFLLNFPTDKIAVIDSVTCKHPKSAYSALDQVVPRHLHKHQGIEFLKEYGLLPDD